ncbi:hypothetical protein HDU67_000593 [Dinochytrium kinnereticum]|nr:hypothetical protein HDU67_000593 [Dinochytrium kinnereticum]
MAAIEGLMQQLHDGNALPHLQREEAEVVEVTMMEEECKDDDNEEEYQLDLDDYYLPDVEQEEKAAKDFAGPGTLKDADALSRRRMAQRQRSISKIKPALPHLDAAPSSSSIPLVRATAKQPKMDLESLLRELDESLLISTARNAINKEENSVVPPAATLPSPPLPPPLTRRRRPSVASTSSSESFTLADPVFGTPSTVGSRGSVLGAVGRKGADYSLKRLLAPPRGLHNGHLLKLSTSQRPDHYSPSTPSARTSWKRRLFALTNDSMFLFRAAQNQEASEYPLTFLNLNASSIVTPLGDLAVVDDKRGLMSFPEVVRAFSGDISATAPPLPPIAGRWCFAVRSGSEAQMSERVWILGAATEAEMIHWVMTLRAVVSAYRSRLSPPSPISPTSTSSLHASKNTIPIAGQAMHPLTPPSPHVPNDAIVADAMALAMEANGAGNIGTREAVTMLQYRLEQQQQIQQRLMVEQELRRQIAVQQMMIQQQYQAYAAAMASAGHSRQPMLPTPTSPYPPQHTYYQHPMQQQPIAHDVAAAAAAAYLYQHQQQLQRDQYAQHQQQQYRQQDPRQYLYDGRPPSIDQQTFTSGGSSPSSVLSPSSSIRNAANATISEELQTGSARIETALAVPIASTPSTVSKKKKINIIPAQPPFSPSLPPSLSMTNAQIEAAASKTIAQPAQNNAFKRLFSVRRREEEIPSHSTPGHSPTKKSEIKKQEMPGPSTAIDEMEAVKTAMGTDASSIHSGKTAGTEKRVT